MWFVYTGLKRRKMKMITKRIGFTYLCVTILAAFSGCRKERKIKCLKRNDENEN